MLRHGDMGPAYSFLLRNMKVIRSLTFSTEVGMYFSTTFLKKLAFKEMSKKFGNILLEDLP